MLGKSVVPLMIALCIVSATKQLCDQISCPDIRKGDGECNLNCMNVFCGYDSALHDPASKKVSSDCYWDCISIDGCDPKNLGDGICHDSCNTKSCGFDWGDCGNCASSCLIDLENGNENKVCDPNCNVPSCYYGLGACKECSIGCTAEMMGDGVCDIECQNSQCNFDLGDCFNATCAPGCYLWMIGNSICEEACHVEECNYDEYDCDCSPGCFEHMLGDGNCDEACNNWNCTLDNHDCGACASGCYPEMLGDTNCDPECSNYDCYHDYQDCQCAEGCTYLDYGKCKSECLVASCNYDKVLQFQDLWCQNTSLAIFSSYQQNIRKNYTYVAHLEDCYTASDYECTIDKAFDLANCYPECNIIECNYANGNCNERSNEDYACARFYGNSSLGQCMACTNSWFEGWVLLDGICVDILLHTSKCPYRLPDSSYFIWDYQDTSSISNPYIYFVTSTPNGLEFAGDGTFNWPYQYLWLSMSSLSHNYMVVYLLDDGPYSIDGSGYYEDNHYCQSSFSSFNPKYLKIESWTGKQVIIQDLYYDWGGLHFIRSYNQIFELSNIIFKGSYWLEGCSGAYCDYCPFIMYKAGIGSLNDREEVVSEFMPENVCKDQNFDSSFLPIENANAFLTNVSFVNFRTSLWSIINYYDNSNITLKNVTFDNIILSSKEQSAVIVGGINIELFGLEAPGGNFYYSEGTVSRINNGYELLDPKDLRGFLYIVSGGSVSIKNVEFRNNIVHRKEFTLEIESELSTASLIAGKFSGAVEIDSCTFIYNYCELGLINLPLTFSTGSVQVDNKLEVKQSKANQLLIKHSRFESNYGKSVGILLAKFVNQNQNVLIDNCTLYSNGVENGALIDIQAGYIDEEHLNDKYLNYTVPSGVIIQVKYLAKWLEINDVQFNDNNCGKSGLLSIKRMGNIKMSNSLMQSNGIMSGKNINSILLDFYISDPNLYLKLRVSNPASLDCKFLSSISDSLNFTMSEMHIENNHWENSSPSIIISNTTNPFINSSHFNDNSGQSTNGTCLFFTKVASILIFGSEFARNVNNLPSSPGVIYVDSNCYQLSLISCNFTENSADLGGALYFLGQVLSIESTDFDSNISPLLSGGAIYYALASLQTGSHSLSISNSKFTKNVGLWEGGAIYIQWKLSLKKEMSLYMYDSEFSFNKAEYGAAIYIDSTLALSGDSLIEGCIFRENVAQTSGIISIFYIYGTLLFNKCEFVKNSGNIGAALEITIGESSISSVSKVILKSCSFRQNEGTAIILMQDSNTFSLLDTFYCEFISNAGVTFSLDYDSLSDVGSTINSSFSESSGAVFDLRNRAKVQSEGIFISNCATLKNGGVVSMSSNSEFICTSCSFIKNNAGLLGGVIYAASNSYFAIQDSIFKQNSCPGPGAVFYLVSLVESSSVIRKSKIEENYSLDGGIIALLSSKIAIESTIIFNNTLDKGSAELYITNSVATITNTTFSDHLGNQGQFISINTYSQAIIQDSFILNGKSDSSGIAISATGSTANIANTVFLNLSSNNGGIISLDAGSLLRLGNCSISASPCSAIDAINCDLFIYNTTFQDYTTTAIRGRELNSLQVSNSVFSEGRGQNGGSIYCLRCKDVAIQSSLFENNTSEEGGAIYFATDTDFPINNKHLISLSTFKNNTSSIGGAVYADSINLEIYQSNFSKNSAVSLELNTAERGVTDGTGGAVNFNCQNFCTCSFNVSFCSFYWNKATYNGGAVNWKYAKYLFNENKFISNFAEYGDDMSSSPVAMEYVNQNSTVGEHSGNRKLTTSLTLNNVASGQESKFPIAFALVDHLNQVIKTDNISQAQLQVVSPSSALISGLTIVYAVQGVFNFSGYTITAEPGSSAQIRVYTSAIQETSDSIEDSSSFYIDVKLRLCELGEATVNGTCYGCKKPYYSLNPKNTACLSCPSSAICYDNYTIVPKKGYWRNSMMTSKFWKCPYSKACLGSPDIHNLSYTGVCKEGYKGNMCQSCKHNYSRLYKNECIKCPGIVSNIFRLLGFLVFIIAILVIMIKTARNSVYRSEAFTSVYIRIFWNFLQVLVIITTFNLNWPNEVIELFHINDILDYTGQLLYSLECFLQLSVSRDDVYFKRIVISSAMPFCLGIFCFTGWFLWKIKTKRFHYIMDDFISTAVVMLFLIHPSLMHDLFSIYSCKEIDPGEFWLNADLNIRCWTPEHSFYAFIIAMPAIIIWGIAVPALCLTNLVRNWDRLDEVWIKLRYGFLFNGYKSKYYYWEFVIAYSKMILIAFSVFLSNVSIAVQAIAVVILLYVFLHTQRRNKPFILQIFNRMEFVSKCISLLTAFSGLFFLTGALNYAGKFFLLVIVLLSNIAFALWCLYKCTLEAFKIVKILILALKRGRVEIGIDENYESNIDHCNAENSKIQDQSYNLVPNQTRIGTNTENLEKSLNDQDSLCCEKDPFPSEAGSM
ncbi:unnamed protein product [Blepharisma stoltei]|uniref:LNR domain-containing protein n=1 Tax=Blepharisma stoltei TaxID=1481888 RepID=A0AAU9J0R3_9CILI|nr:unnamed protein product [Blepharisma stoltei]